MIIELSEGRHVFCDNSDTQIWCHDLQLFFIFFFVDHLLVLLFYFWQKRGGQKLKRIASRKNPEINDNRNGWTFKFY
jgi:hypothetical protein